MPKITESPRKTHESALVYVRFIILCFYLSPVSIVLLFLLSQSSIVLSHTIGSTGLLMLLSAPLLF